jgi:hypothetical protein
MFVSTGRGLEHRQNGSLEKYLVQLIPVRTDLLRSSVLDVTRTEYVVLFDNALLPTCSTRPWCKPCHATPHLTHLFVAS